MKNLFALMLVLFLTAGLCAGCIFDSDDDDDDDKNGGGAGTAAEYFPLSPGNVWTFDEVEVYAGGDTQTDSYTIAYNGTQTQDGKTYVALKESDEDDAMLFRIDSNIIYMINPDMDMEKTASGSKAAAITKIEAEEVPWMDFNKGAGGTWTIYELSEQYEGYSFTYEMKGKYVGTETVSVPAGTYAGCKKFEMTSHSSFTAGNEMEEDTDTQTFWFAKNVGLVKIMEIEYEEGVIDYTSTSVLKSHSTSGGN